MVQLQAQTDAPLPPVEDTVLYLPPAAESPVVITDNPGATTGDTLYFNHKDYAGRYDSAALHYRRVPDTVIAALKADPDFWYADKTKDRQEAKEVEVDLDNTYWGKILRSISKNWNTMMIIFGVIVFAAVIWLLFNNKWGLFGRLSRAVDHATRFTNEQEIQHSDLPSAIAHAEAAGNYRLAVRLQYIHLLSKMAESGQIQFSEDATNMQYLMQVYQQPYYKQFFSVTRHYEYVWYGEMPVDARGYAAIASVFNDLLHHPKIQS